mmetsp:Transcript_34787/g.81209  ORF Transcript_34787/g.81209 Transcript_34787/m.81209 type:complete len:329 (+) Transcript_34787:130-1116(+)
MPLLLGGFGITSRLRSVLIAVLLLAFDGLQRAEARLGSRSQWSNAASRTFWLQEEPVSDVGGGRAPTHQGRGEGSPHDLDAKEVAAMAQQALVSQQKAMLALAEQQAKLVKEEEAMEAKEGEMQRTIAMLEAERQPDEAPSWFGNGCCAPVRAYRWYWNHWMVSLWEPLLAALAYILILAFAGWYYRKQLRKRHIDPVGRNPDDWYFGLLDTRECCGRDQLICCCACCCLPVRWAATAGSSKVKFIPYWPALFLFAILWALGPLTAGVSIVIAAAFAVACRQRIRDLWNLGNTKYRCSSMSLDCLLWICCPALAAIQEAREVEYTNAY